MITVAICQQVQIQALNGTLGHEFRMESPALYLLCTTGTVEAAEALITGVRRTPPTADSGPRDDETIALLRDLVRRLRLELGAGLGKRHDGGREQL
jgi:hypothetical protein